MPRAVQAPGACHCEEPKRSRARHAAAVTQARAHSVAPLVVLARSAKRDSSQWSRRSRRTDAIAAGGAVVPPAVLDPVVAAHRRAGSAVTRVKGSHHFLRHTDGRSTVVPAHAGETVGPCCSGGRKTPKTSKRKANPALAWKGTRARERASGIRLQRAGLSQTRQAGAQPVFDPARAARSPVSERDSPPGLQPSARQASTLAYRVLRGTGAAVDVLVWPRSRFEARSRVVTSLPATVLRAGRLLHAA